MSKAIEENISLKAHLSRAKARIQELEGLITQLEKEIEDLKVSHLVEVAKLNRALKAQEDAIADRKDEPIDSYEPLNSDVQSKSAFFSIKEEEEAKNKVGCGFVNALHAKEHDDMIAEGREKIGTIVTKVFDGRRCMGNVVALMLSINYSRYSVMQVEYDDGNSEKMGWSEFDQIIAPLHLANAYLDDLEARDKKGKKKITTGTATSLENNSPSEANEESRRKQSPERGEGHLRIRVRKLAAAASAVSEDHAPPFPPSSFSDDTRDGALTSNDDLESISARGADSDSDVEDSDAVVDDDEDEFDNDSSMRTFTVARLETNAWSLRYRRWFRWRRRVLGSQDEAEDGKFDGED
ncbi:hypothetical protein GH714_036780 [Hevea brasiliensis]|uniref:Uncharacterized protein n=1 Tax=Hevea brasiliensis TaxID=3981 RepID=A0A6A6MM92_HEVBR|nr:hypothetical protein GH714_036780 [Hevea brasiliensis]